MLIDSLYNNLSQNLLSIFGNNPYANPNEQNNNVNNQNEGHRSATNHTSASGDKITISAEAKALYAQKVVEEAEQKQDQNTEGNGERTAADADRSASVVTQIQALQGQLASLTSQVNADDPLSVSQIDQLRAQISILQAQMSS